MYRKLVFTFGFVTVGLCADECSRIFLATDTPSISEFEFNVNKTVLHDILTCIPCLSNISENSKRGDLVTVKGE